LEKAHIQEGKLNSHYAFSIEDESNVIQLLGNESLQTSRKIDGLWDCTPKPLGIEVLISELTERFYNNDILAEENIKNILYKPFVRCIERNVVTGTYFDKPLFSTANIITGTKDFDGLLQLVRESKNTTDDGCIIGNTSVINEVKHPRQSRGLVFVNRSKRFLLFDFLSLPFSPSGFVPLPYPA
jgi:hypothetical protein